MRTKKLQRIDTRNYIRYLPLLLFPEYGSDSTLWTVSMELQTRQDLWSLEHLFHFIGWHPGYIYPGPFFIFPPPNGRILGSLYIFVWNSSISLLYCRVESEKTSTPKRPDLMARGLKDQPRAEGVHVLDLLYNSNARVPDQDEDCIVSYAVCFPVLTPILFWHQSSPSMFNANIWWDPQAIFFICPLSA